MRSVGEAMCDRSNQNFDGKRFAELNQAVLSPAAVAAWQQCVSNKDVHVDTTVSDTDQGAKGLTLSFYSAKPGQNADKVNWVKTSENLKCSGGPKLSPLINNDQAVPISFGSTVLTVTCTRTIAKEPFQAGSRKVFADNSTLTVSTTAGAIERELPAILPAPLPNPIPAGTIVAWSGQGAPPSGWAICDGTNGTPDLRNRFLMGAGQSSEVLKVGGTNQQTVDVPIDKIFLATGGTDHPYALRVDNADGIINHQTACAQCNLVDSFTKPATAHGQFDNRPAFTEVVYIIKL
jgi:hypothetical protein